MLQKPFIKYLLRLMNISYSFIISSLLMNVFNVVNVDFFKYDNK